MYAQLYALLYAKILIEIDKSKNQNPSKKNRQTLLLKGFDGFLWILIV